MVRHPEPPARVRRRHVAERRGQDRDRGARVAAARGPSRRRAREPRPDDNDVDVVVRVRRRRRRRRRSESGRRRDFYGRRRAGRVVGRVVGDAELAGRSDGDGPVGLREGRRQGEGSGMRRGQNRGTLVARAAADRGRPDEGRVFGVPEPNRSGLGGDEVDVEGFAGREVRRAAGDRAPVLTRQDLKGIGGVEAGFPRGKADAGRGTMEAKTKAVSSLAGSPAMRTDPTSRGWPHWTRDGKAAAFCSASTRTAAAQRVNVARRGMLRIWSSSDAMERLRV